MAEQVNAAELNGTHIDRTVTVCGVTGTLASITHERDLGTGALTVRVRVKGDAWAHTGSLAPLTVVTIHPQETDHDDD